MALGRVVPARRAIAASSARQGEKARNVLECGLRLLYSLEDVILDVLLVVDHDFLTSKIGVRPARFF